jgi:hypothetical protein
MPQNKPPSNYSKKPARRVRLLKIGPQKTKSLFEEYFYGFAVAIALTVMVLGKAGGLDGYDAIVTGLWVGGILWFGWVFKNYRKKRAIAGSIEKSVSAAQTSWEMIKNSPHANMKPMIGPQWPLRTTPGALRPLQRSIRPVKEPVKPVQTPPQSPAQAGPVEAAPAAPGSANKRGFVYERPTLPDRKPKLPNNWPGRPDKKPKR